MQRSLPLAALLACTLGASSSPAQDLRDPIDANVPLGDTARIVTLPSPPEAPAGMHGMLGTTDDGRFRFADGTPARFVGVTLEWSACLPDSAQAVVMAARLAKLGVNLVRVRYFENTFAWGAAISVLDPVADFRALHPERMRRFDWLVHQLRAHGTYLYLTLQSARAPLGSDGFGELADSSLWLGAGLYHLYPQGRATLKSHARLLLDHVNPFTGRAYRDEPAVAMIELMERGSILSLWRQGFTDHINGAYRFSFDHARRLDTLFAEHLTTRYGGDDALAAAWRVSAPPGGFPNVVQEGSFEGDFQRYWEAGSFDGPTVTPILTQNDSVPDGDVAMTLRVRNTAGTITQAYLRQDVPLEYNTLYRLSFRARSSNAAGRSVALLAYETTDGSFAGLQSVVSVSNSWGAHEATFLTPRVMNGPVAIYLFFGDIDDDLSIDDVQLRAIEPGGLQPGEHPADATVQRVPHGSTANLLLSTRRIEDQSEFMIGLDRDLFADLRRYVRDSIGARQPITGAAHYWASNMMEVAAQRSMDFTNVSAGWDWIESRDSGIHLRNTSQLRQDHAAAIYELSAFANDRQPFVASFAQPHPNRYLAESMTMLPAYALHQGWDAILFDVWTDDRTFDTISHITSSEYHELAKNPVANALLPAIAAMFREGLVAPARGTIRLQHTRRQIAQIPRFYWAWGKHAAPAWIPGFAPAVSRIVHDSLDASGFTQVGDISFPPTLDGEASTDTRQVRWEFAEGVLSIDAPHVQAATGHLSRSAGISLTQLDVEVLSSTETATAVWIALDSTRTLEDAGRSLLVLTTRTEPAGLRWSDTSTVVGWGTGPMLLEPMRARLRFTFESPVGRLLVTPLDSSGRPVADTLAVAPDGSILIDQARTRAQWYEVVVDRGSGAEQSVAASALSLRVTHAPGADGASLHIAMPVADDARLELLDALGRRLRSLPLGFLAAGTHRRSLDLTDLPSGTYTLTLRTASSTTTTRIPIAR